MLRDIGKSMREPRLFWLALFFLLMMSTDAEPSLISGMEDAYDCVTNDGKTNIVDLFKKVQKDWTKEENKNDTSGFETSMKSIKKAAMDTINRRILDMKIVSAISIVIFILILIFGYLYACGYLCCKYVKSDKCTIIGVTWVIAIVVLIIAVVCLKCQYYDSLMKCRKLQEEADEFEKELKPIIEEVEAVFEDVKAIVDEVEEVVDKVEEVVDEVEEIVGEGFVIANDIGIEVEKAAEAVEEESEKAFAKVKKDMNYVMQKTENFMEEEYESVTEEGCLASLLYVMVFAFVVLGICLIWIETPAEENHHEIIEV